MQVVANPFLLKILSRIDIFKLDLGDNLTGAMSPNGRNQVKITIKDVFIKTYNNTTGRMIFRYGDIGTLKFYQDSNLANHEMCVFKDDDIYELEIDIDYLRVNPKAYLSEIIQGIVEGNEKEQEYDDQTYNVAFKGKSFSSNDEEEVNNKYLSKDDLISKLLKERQESDRPSQLPDEIVKRMRHKMDDALINKNIK